jgi:putative spermidine/putrescine transport system permease protein
VTRLPRKLRRVVATAALGTLGGAVLLFLAVPVLSVIPMSFSSSMVFELIPRDPGLSQYRRFFSSPEWMAALGRSFQVALGTTVVATTMGTLAALGLRRLRGPRRAVLEALLIAPRIVPSIVLAVALYFVFSQAGLVGTISGLVLAHSVLAFPFVVVLVGSALFAFNVSFDEVVVTLFISGVRTKTLPVKVWDAILYEITPILPAISTVIIVASVLLLTPLLLARRSP